MDFKEKVEKLNLNFDDEFYSRCEMYKTLLQQWGMVHNLSAELEDYKIENNMVDSIYPLTFLNDFNSFADIGTGSGYPGMLLAIARPEVKTYLIEPRAKRVAFLNFVKNSLKLTNVEVIAKRVEQVKDLKVELVTSRAVTNTKLLLDITENIVDENSSFLFYKGSRLDSEIDNSKFADFEVISVKDRNFLYIKRK